ncbi:MAG: lipoyl(octanoyl) transferase LipB [Phycisphaeraceae bacterium]|nr:lipoyl(octanoyl) transferase LipB [Phycisphaeraceae bacterium]
MSLLQVIDLGRMAYTAAHERQEQVHAEVVAGDRPATLLTVEHDPVITVSRRPTAAEHVVADEAELKQRGIEIASTDRGGDVTYHGPGQLVAYPIIPLSDFHLNIGRYLRLLEQVVIDTVARFGVTAHRDEAGTGVWVTPADGGPAAKLCAIGVRVRRGVTLHGLALNVTTDLDHFATIVPCGIADRSVTRLKDLLGGDCPDRATVADALAETMEAALAARLDDGASS